jgi:hypothetical protein
MLTPTVLLRWLDGWWTILDTHGKLFLREKSNNVAVLDTLKQVRLAPTTTPLTCLSPSSTLIKVDLTGDINKSS